MKKQYIPEIIAQVKVCGEKDTFCAHPLQAGEIYHFGNNEIAFFHLHTDEVDYNGDTILDHGQNGIHSMAKVMLTRSYDGGRTWKKEDSIAIFDQGTPLETRKAMLQNRMTEEDAEPVTDNTIFTWIQSFCGPLFSDGKTRQLVNFAMRSDDKGHTWSEQITMPDNIGFSLLQACGSGVRQGNRLLKGFVVSTKAEVDNCGVSEFRCVLYASENNGVTWQYVSEIARDKWNEDSYSYISIVDLGEEHLLATMGCWKNSYAGNRWISVCDSYDNGLNWTEPRRIQSFGVSPYPLRLRDGRIVVVYARRYPASVMGMYGMVSCDDGKTWSEEFVLRKGASGSDIGYPVVIETEGGNIFTGYYWMEEDGQLRGGARFIAGTIFRLP